MQYRGALTIPAGTPVASPEVLTLPVGYGVLERFVIHFPPGQAGTTFFQVWYRGRQILPTSLGQSFRGDDLVIDLPETFQIFDKPFELDLFGWSPDATYDHTVYTIFYITAPVVVQASILDVEQIPLPLFEE